jgi:hypothetical protein
MEQLGDRQVGDLVVDRRPQEDDPLAKEARVDVEGALTVHGLLDHHRNLRAHRCSWILCFQAILVPRSRLTESDIIAPEASGYRTRFEAIEKRLAEVEQVNARLESAALTTSRAMAEISNHWDAVYEATRRSEEKPSS